MICFPKGLLVLRYALVKWMLYFSHFFKRFLQVYTEFVYVQKYVIILVFIICSLLVGIDCVTGKSIATFSWMKNTPFCSQI